MAIKNTRLPEVSFKDDKISINRDFDKQTYLNVHHIPVCTTFYWIANLKGVIVDATAKEEKLATARLSICMNVYEDMCGMLTLG
jgi:exosome complex component RRP45